MLELSRSISVDLAESKRLGSLLLSSFQVRFAGLEMLFFFSFIIYYLFLFTDLGEGAREIAIYYSTYLCIRQLLLIRALTGDQTHNLDISGRCSTWPEPLFLTITVTVPILCDASVKIKRCFSRVGINVEAKFSPSS